MIVEKVRGANIELSCIENNNIAASYQISNWLMDDSLNKYLESRFQNHDMFTQIRYITEKNFLSNCLYFGIYFRHEGALIGTISAEWNQIHQTASLGILIGDKTYWGRGLATESIELMSRYLFATQNVRKIKAGIYKNNLASIKAFERAGFKVECLLKKEVVDSEGNVDDVFILSRFL